MRTETAIALLGVMAAILAAIVSGGEDTKPILTCSEARILHEGPCKASEDGLPPRVIPAELESAFSREGMIPITYEDHEFVDDSFGGKGSHYAYSADDVAAFGDQAEVLEPVVAEVLKAHRRLLTKVAVFGSQKPVIEGLLLKLGARRIVTVEYNALTIAHERIRTVRGNRLPEDVGRVRLAVLVDALQHDGLGRYGDPVCPDADLQTMDHVLERASFALISVPTGPDAVVWNAHRVYGPTRLPLLLQGWSIEAQREFASPALHRTIMLLRRADLAGMERDSAQA